MEKNAKHQEVDDKPVSRHKVYIFFHLFPLFMYSHHSVLPCILVSKLTEQGSQKAQE